MLVALHYSIDFGESSERIEALYFLPVSLLLVPVVFAALTYGLVGAITTTLWVIVLTIPDLFFGHQGLQRVGVIAELLLLAGIASVIGWRVDRERRLQKHTARMAADLKASTTKYQGLLESSPISVMLVSPQGSILEANSATSMLFGKAKAVLTGMRLADLLGAEGAQCLLSDAGASLPRDTLTLRLDARELVLETRTTRCDDGLGNPVIQVLLRDVTEEYHRRVSLRAYAAEVIRALEEERQLIARELHDETIQELILLRNRLEDAAEMAAPLSEPLSTRLREARASAEGIVSGLRDFARSLRPPVLDDLGITVSVRRLLADFAERTKIEGQLVVAGKDRRLPSNTEIGIFRIAQEALRNVEHHAEANYVAVIMTFTEHGVRLDIVDNGVGFQLRSPSDDFTASGHLGLISMQERAELLGGTLEVKSSPGKGTRVTISVPDSATHVEALDRDLGI